MKNRSKKVRRTKGRKSGLNYLSVVFVIIACFIFGYLLFKNFLDSNNISIIKPKEVVMYVANNINDVVLYKKKKIEEEGKEERIVLVEKEKISRGIEVKATKNKMKYEDINYQEIKVNDKKYYIDEKLLVKNKKNVVMEKKIYVRSATSVLEDIETRKILGLAKKGEGLEVVDYDSVDESGYVNMYKVKLGEHEGYIYGKYTDFNEENAKRNYDEATYNPIHEKVRNTYDGGDAIKLDFYPMKKPVFENNKMPDAIYALYLNCGSDTIKNIDSYIQLAKETKINAFVVDIKDNETPAYPADTFKNLSPSNYEKAINSKEDYKNAISKLKENGFYVIGRITTFKDSLYIKDHPEDAILDKSTGSPFLHNGSYWPSAYNRNVWFYTLSLAKEAVKEFGFNEINFDYVRFPDRMNSIISRLDLKNIYDEDKAEAIQRFVQYVTDGLHEEHVYVSIDVFGESTNGTYVTAYGQYWPAISNVADVISGMPYPDHFAAGSYGLQKPWNNPHALMKYWASYAMERQKECPTPAKVRTWIQAYDVMRYVDSNGISYGAQAVEQEIRGLYESGAIDGYITWLSNSSISKYRSQAPAFSIDYRKEYVNEDSNTE